MDELYKEYGQLLIQAEILQGRINEVKKQIADKLNRDVPKQLNKDLPKQEK